MDMEFCASYCTILENNQKKVILACVRPAIRTSEPYLYRWPMKYFNVA